MQDLYEECHGATVIKINLIDLINEYNIVHKCNWTEKQKMNLLTELDYQIRMTLFKFYEYSNNQSKII